MNELESILNYLETTSLEPHDDYTSEFTYKEQKLLWNYIKQLKEQLETSEKARKEAIDYIKELYDNTDDTTCYDIDKDEKERLLEILDIDKGDEQ